MTSGNIDAAMKLMDEFAQKNPERASRIEATRFYMLLPKKEYDRAYQAAAKAVEGINDDATTLNELAWTIVDTAGLEKRDLDVAMKAATKANDLSHGKDAAILDTLARVYFEKGQIDKAIEIETHAVDNATGQMKPELEKVLEKYKKARTAKTN
jgi:tetratricopeptide (TPR) repeat protein